MKEKAISLILLILANPGFAAETATPVIQPSEGKARPKDWQSLAVDPGRPRRFIEITQDLELLCQAPGSKPSARSLMVFKGAYLVERRLRHIKSGVDWLAIPAVSSLPITLGYNNSAGRTWGYEHAIVLNPDTLAIFPREVVRYTQEWSRLNGSRWSETAWAFSCVPNVVNAAERPLLRFITEDQFQAIRNGQDRQIALEAIEQHKRREQVIKRERPLKSKIGAQLCRESGPWILQGFTEGRSPDNGKLQIRIWRTSLSDHGRQSTVVPSNFHESIVWDSPDNWTLCE